MRAPAADGAVVVCVDNFFTGARGNIEHLLNHRHFEVIRHDVIFPLYVEVVPSRTLQLVPSKPRRAGGVFTLRAGQARRAWGAAVRVQLGQYCCAS
jgi:hypothetical protein